MRSMYEIDQPGISVFLGKVRLFFFANIPPIALIKKYLILSYLIPIEILSYLLH